jgi:2-amino-4-hydroxy-6-hydroxymethyldihydropteridine diphosphokinase
MNNPLNLVSLTPSMLDASFGVLVGILTVFILSQKKMLPLWPTLDSLSPLLLVVFMGIHLAKYANGNAYGLPTDLPWGIQLWNAVRHPVQLYAVILGMILFIWMLIHTQLFKSTGFMRSGVLFAITLAGMALITLFNRAFAAEKILLGSLDFIQLTAFLFFIGALALVSARAYPSRRKVGVIISMGSNLDPMKHLTQAEEEITSKFRIRRKSSRYKTEDVNENPSTPAFINQVIEIETVLPFQDLRAQLKAIEQALGREPGNKVRVALDLDILTYGKEVFSTNNHRIPAPDMLKYRYIALPLAEMMPDFRHPANGLPIHVIVDKLTDTSAMTQIHEVENGIEA